MIRKICVSVSECEHKEYELVLVRVYAQNKGKIRKREPKIRSLEKVAALKS